MAAPFYILIGGAQGSSHILHACDFRVCVSIIASCWVCSGTLMLVCISMVNSDGERLLCASDHFSVFLGEMSVQEESSVVRTPPCPLGSPETSVLVRSAFSSQAAGRDGLRLPHLSGYLPLNPVSIVDVPLSVIDIVPTVEDGVAGATWPALGPVSDFPAWGCRASLPCWTDRGGSDRRPSFFSHKQPERSRPPSCARVVLGVLRARGKYAQERNWLPPPRAEPEELGLLMRGG